MFIHKVVLEHRCTCLSGIDGGLCSTTVYFGGCNGNHNDLQILTIHSLLLSDPLCKEFTTSEIHYCKSAQ